MRTVTRDARDSRASHAEELTDGTFKLALIVILNIAAAGAAYYYFKVARSAAQAAAASINADAFSNIALRYPSSPCVYSPSYSDSDFSGNHTILPRRVCNRLAISYYAFSSLDLEAAPVYLCSAPFNVSDPDALYQLMEYMQTCSMVRYLSEQLPAYGYRFAGELTSSQGMPEGENILDYYFNPNKTQFDYSDATLYPSRCFEGINGSLHWYGGNLWFGHAHDLGVELIMPGTLQLITLQPKNIWLELFPYETSGVSCSVLPQNLAANASCLFKLLNASDTMAFGYGSDRGQFRCQGSKVSLDEAAAKGNFIGAVLTSSYCERYSCFNLTGEGTAASASIDHRFFSQFNDEFTILQTQNTYSFLRWSLPYLEINNFYIALMGVFCAMVLTAVIATLVACFQLYHKYTPGLIWRRSAWCVSCVCGSCVKPAVARMPIDEETAGSNVACNSAHAASFNINNK